MEQKIYVEVSMQTLERIAELSNLYDLSERTAAAGFGTSEIDGKAEELARRIGQAVVNTKKPENWIWDIEYYKKENANLKSE